ncbi:MAG TPA: hypothetical protein VG408_04155, partial [Actinomycetota bacterium]|nr:hypothetical protein [Actinomycetota bacterium]
MSGWSDATIIKTPQAISDFFREAQARCRSSVDILVKGSEPLATAQPAEEHVLEKGIRVRCIYERSLLQTSRGESYLKQWRERGEEQLVLDSVPVRAAVIDRSIVLVPIAAEGPAITSLLVVRAGLGEALAYLV